jgi:DNA invertase Pin-like site-specific DNA recombinase
MRTKSVWERIELQTDKPLIIYPRQSTTRQTKENIYSREMQTTDLIEYAQKLGWGREVRIVSTPDDLDDLITSVEQWRNTNIIIVLEIDLGVSGRLKIEKRRGMSTVVFLIGEGAVKTVMCQKEDRLFRDDTGLEYNTYIQVCLHYEVITVTAEDYRYDFSIREHKKRFREKCEQASDFLEDYVRDRLIRGRQKAAAEGRYVGGGIPPGFVPDRQKYLPTGEKNPYFRKLTPYKPWVPIIHWIFERYQQLGGNLFELRKEIAAMPVLFPDLEESAMTEGEVRKLHLRRVSGGHQISISGLKAMLCNVVMIGWYHDKYGLLVDEDGIPVRNHLPIIEEHEQDLFWFAFDRISTFALDGTRKRPVPARFTTTKPCPALLKDIIVSGEEGKTVLAYQATNNYVMYAVRTYNPLLTPTEMMTDHREVDNVFVKRLFGHLTQSRDYDHYRDYVTTEIQAHEQKWSHIDVQLQAIAEQIAAVEANLDLPPSKLSKERREKYAERLGQLEARKAELEREKRLPKELAAAKELLEYRELITEMLVAWDEQTLEFKKSLIATFTEKVEFVIHSPHWYTLTVSWRDPTWGVEVGIVWKRTGINKGWTEEEVEILKAHYATSTKEDLQRLLPMRTWTSIRRNSWVYGVTRHVLDRHATAYLESLCHTDRQFMEQHGITYDAMPLYKTGVWTQLCDGKAVSLPSRGRHRPASARSAGPSLGQRAHRGL